MSRAVMLLAALLALPAAGGARAQDMEEATGKEARVTLALFSDCVVKQSAAKLRKLVDVASYGEGAPAWQALMDPGCLEDAVEPGDVSGRIRLGFSVRLMRGGVFDSLYRKDFGKAPAVTSFEGVPKVSYPGSDPRVAAHGDCLVRAAPLESRALLLTRATTGAEVKALAAIAPASDKCLRGADLMAIGPANLRGGVAESLYRLTKASQAAPLVEAQ